MNWDNYFETFYLKPTIFVYNKFIPFKGFTAINICGIIFVRYGSKITESLQRHERIHSKQCFEMLISLFYIWYIVEWLIRCCIKLYKKIVHNEDYNAYRELSFEKEAKANENNPNYLTNRKRFAWLKYL